MNTNLLAEKDLDTKRRLALAKVYEILLKLAKTAEPKSDSMVLNDNKENETSTLKDNIPP